MHKKDATEEGAQKTADIERFFQDYVAAFNRSLVDPAGIDAVCAAYAPCFVAAGPTGVLCAHNNEEFRAFLERGYEHYRALGTRKMALIKVELTTIDENHQMAKVFFSSEYERPNGELVTIDFDVTYLLHIENGAPQIFAYVAGDEEAAFRAHGIEEGGAKSLLR